MQKVKQKNKILEKFSLLIKLSLVLVVSFGAFGTALLAVPEKAAAQESIKFSVTPPLFQINMAKGEQWASTIKVVNNNKEDLPVYTSVMNFEAQGEKGYGKFAPIIHTDPEEAPQLLAYWVTVSADPVIVPGESSVTIPFSIKIPKDAPPGGHYAAIMVGNAPFGAPEDEGIALSVSSMVTSLLFVRIQGETNENGEILDFYPDRKWYQEPKVNFNLRFENTGNVHLRPQGEIKITNMWGKEKGKIPINQKTNFGNVLRNSIRKFEYTWESEAGLLESGRYTALATLTFGLDSRQTVNQEASFWIIPLKPVLATLGGIIIGILLLIFGIKAFVKRLVSRQARMLGLPASGLETMPSNPNYLSGNHNQPKKAYLIKRRTSSNTNKTKDMSKSENSNRKVKRNKPAYDEVVPLSEEGDKKRLKGMAWLKKEQQKQNTVAEQEIESAPAKKRFSITGMVKFKKPGAETEESISGAGKKVASKKSNKEIIEEIAKEEKAIFKQLGTLLMSSRRYIITVLITVVVMGGIFGAMNYFSAKDKDDSNVPERESTMQVESEKPAAVVEEDKANTEPASVVDSLYAEEGNTAEETTDSTTEFITGSESDEAEVVIKDPEDLQPAIDPVDVAVAVYNGSGIPGLAGQYADKIETLGFNVADVGNADSFDYIFSEINYTAEVASLREQISDVLVGASQSQENVDQDYDIILIIGKNEDTN